MRAFVPMIVVLLSNSACSFPDVDYSPALDEGGLSDANGGEAAAEDARNDGQDPDAGGAGDGGKKDADPCDVDDDGFRSKGGTCGGLDCDDNDNRRNPGVSTYLTYPTADGGWNCARGVEKQFPTNVNCCGIVGQAQCNAAAGFFGDPACGALSPTFVTCAWNLIAVPPLCSLKTTTSQTQGQ